MWILMTAVGLSLALTRYALVPFFRESKRAERSHRHDSNREAPTKHSARLIVMASRCAIRASTASGTAKFGRG